MPIVHAVLFTQYCLPARWLQPPNATSVQGSGAPLLAFGTMSRDRSANPSAWAVQRGKHPKEVVFLVIVCQSWTLASL